LPRTFATAAPSTRRASSAASRSRACVSVTPSRRSISSALASSLSLSFSAIPVLLPARLVDGVLHGGVGARRALSLRPVDANLVGHHLGKFVPPRHQRRPMRRIAGHLPDARLPLREQFQE